MLMVLLARGHRPRLGEGLLLLGFGLMTVQSIRNELWWGLALTPFVARSLTAWSTRLASGIAVGVPALNAVCLALFALVVVAGLPWLRSYVELPTTQAPILDETTPVAVAEYLAQHPTEGQLFNASNWGAYFGWRLGPERRVFIDNRFELHPAEVWTDYIAIGRGHVSWEERVAKYGATQLALDVRAQEPLIEAVRRSPDWTLAYQDHQAVVFDRRPGGE
jgi:hypothetical protein